MCSVQHDSLVSCRPVTLRRRVVATWGSNLDAGAMLANSAKVPIDFAKAPLGIQNLVRTHVLEYALHLERSAEEWRHNPLSADPTRPPPQPNASLTHAHDVGSSLIQASYLRELQAPDIAQLYSIMSPVDAEIGPCAQTYPCAGNGATSSPRPVTSPPAVAAVSPAPATLSPVAAIPVPGTPNPVPAKPTAPAPTPATPDPTPTPDAVPTPSPTPAPATETTPTPTPALVAATTAAPSAVPVPAPAPSASRR